MAKQQLNHYQELKLKLSEHPGDQMLDKMVQQERHRVYDEVQKFIERECQKQGCLATQSLIYDYFTLALETNLLNAKRTFKRNGKVSN